MPRLLCNFVHETLSLYVYVTDRARHARVSRTWASMTKHLNDRDFDLPIRAMQAFKSNQRVKLITAPLSAATMIQRITLPVTRGGGSGRCDQTDSLTDACDPVIMFCMLAKVGYVAWLQEADDVTYTEPSLGVVICGYCGIKDSVNIQTLPDGQGKRVQVLGVRVDVTTDSSTTLHADFSVIHGKPGQQCRFVGRPHVHRVCGTRPQRLIESNVDAHRVIRRLIEC